MEEQKKASENRIEGRIITAVFLVLVFGLTIAGLLTPQKERSESENRTLAQKPEFSFAALFAKEEADRFTVQYEKYLSDQFVARDTWIGIKTRLERLLGKTDINGVYFADDGYLITKTDASAVDAGQEEKNVSRLVQFVKKYQEQLGTGHVYAMVVPTAANILADKLPPFTSEYDQDVLLDRLSSGLPEGSFIDAREELRGHADEYLYYRTDHHWTALGAYYAYRAWARAIGFEARGLDAYEGRVGSGDFYGTLYSKVNLPMQADTVMLYEDGKNYRVEYDMDGKPKNGLFVESRLEEKDKYMVYLDGNHAVVDIVRQETQKNGRRLLVIKDSYAHTFVPFLAQDYEEIVMIDFRYSKMPVSAFVQQYGITDILVLYNATNFVEDENLYQLER